MALPLKANNWYHWLYTGVIRPYTGGALQKIRWFSGDKRNIRDSGLRCLDVHGGKDEQHRHAIWYKCHDGKNQAWRIDTEGINYPAYPLKDGVKFQIRTKMASRRPLFFEDSGQIRIIDNDPFNVRTWWVFDTRTKTIRNVKDRNRVLSVQKGRDFANGAWANARKWEEQSDQFMKWIEGNKRNIQHVRGGCLDVAGGKDAHW